MSKITSLPTRQRHKEQHEITMTIFTFLFRHVMRKNNVCLHNLSYKCSNLGFHIEPFLAAQYNIQHVEFPANNHT